MDRPRIALVTGANKGIGFEICRQLARMKVCVLLAARDEQRGRAAAQSLRAEGLDVRAETLDVTDADQAHALARRIDAEHARCDILVNNAGVLLDPPGSRVLGADPQVFRATLETNFYGPLLVSQAIIPMMKRHRYGRVVNLSSGLGQLQEMGDGTPAYRVSKTALNALTRMLAAATRQDGILVNAMCPGWVRTDMGGGNATRSPEEAAQAALWLATLPDDGPTGGFFRDRQPIAW
jgi:NAD(P)-dependent dehydrogenase (short-subunit alcohol dehydrogenase family)